MQIREVALSSVFQWGLLGRGLVFLLSATSIWCLLSEFYGLCSTFGVMYMALVGSARRRSWLWALAMAISLELAMLLTPYTGYFGIRATALFVTVTLLAHLVFGAVLGLSARRWESRWQPTTAGL